MGDVEAKIIDQCLRFRLPLPDRIRDAPELRLGLELYYYGFLDLHSTRQLDWVTGISKTVQTVGPISISAILEYCGAFGIGGEAREDFIWLIQRMDQHYLQWRRDHVQS